MNFLAHLLLAGDEPEAKIGSLMPDFARPAQIAPTLPTATLAAVRQHRAIDAYTDTHATVARSKARIRHRHGHLTAVLVDVLYDHILARDWARWHHQPLAEFVAAAHEAFTSHAHLMPTTMQAPIQCMIQQQWLVSYDTLDGIGQRLQQMSERFTLRFERPIVLETALVDFVEHDKALTADFNEFFPQLRQLAAEYGISVSGGSDGGVHDAIAQITGAPGTGR